MIQTDIKEVSMAGVTGRMVGDKVRKAMTM